MAAAAANLQSPLITKDIDKEKGEPQQWQPFAGLEGAGQFERQGFYTWTHEEQDLWRQGKLESKWGIGQVSLRLPLQNPLDILAVAYGFLPYLVPFSFLLWSLQTLIRFGSPRFFPTYGLIMASICALVNEVVIKNVCRRVLSEELTTRPPEAVCKHAGMPSGHVMNAYTLMVWAFLEEALDEHVVYPEWLFFIILVMGPVPWARVHNGDHTRPQVAVSVLAGTMMGILVYLIRKIYFPGYHRSASHFAPLQSEGIRVSSPKLHF